MPCTTYIPRGLKEHPDKELQDLLDGMSKKTGNKWWAVTRIEYIKKWFGKTKHSHTDLLADIGFGEAQIFSCVSTEREAIAYLIGALGHMKFDYSITPPTEGPPHGN